MKKILVLMVMVFITAVNLYAQGEEIHKILKNSTYRKDTNNIVNNKKANIDDIVIITKAQGVPSSDYKLKLELKKELKNDYTSVYRSSANITTIPAGTDVSGRIFETSNFLVSDYFNAIDKGTDRRIFYNFRELDSNITIYKDEIDSVYYAEVDFTIFVNKIGKITKIEPAISNDKFLNKIAIRAIKKTNFIAAKKSGKNIDATINIKVQINLPKEPIRVNFMEKPLKMKYLNSFPTEFWYAYLNYGKSKKIKLYDNVKLEVSVFSETMNLLAKDTIDYSIGNKDFNISGTDLIKDMAIDDELILLFRVSMNINLLNNVSRGLPDSRRKYFKIKVLEINPKNK
ncbi:MAG: hypothetical protein WCR42_14965 [bacterium]